MSELIVIIRPSFMKFCKDGCRAALFNHILYWIAWKNQGQTQEAIKSGEITYFATNEELIEHMANAWSDKKVRTEVNALVDLGVIGRTKNQKWGTDRTKHFYFTREQYDRLIELCKEHQICLAHIGLPKEIINLLAAFDKSIECPCTKQTVNLLDANGKSTECNEPILPNANGRIDRNNNKDNNKDNSKGNYERKNGASRQKVTVSTQDKPSHSFIHSSLNFSSSSLSSQEKQEAKQTKPEEKTEISLSAEEQRIHGYWQELGFDAKITANLKEHWGKLVNCIKTFEQFKSLYVHTRQQIENNPEIKNKRVNPGNLTNANNLNGWKQAQEQAKKSVALNEDVTDSDIADMVETWSRLYKDTEHIEEHQARAKQVQRECGMGNSKFFDILFKAKDDTDYSGIYNMDSFFRMLDRQIKQNRPKMTIADIGKRSLSSLPRL